MNRAGSCAADYICVYNAIQCTRSDWERAKQESDSPSLASAETSSTGNGDQRSFCRVLLRTEANPPHTVGEGPGQQEVPLGAAYRVTVCSPAWEPRPRRKHQRPGERQTSLQPEHASQNRPLRAGGTRAPPLEVRGLHAGQGGTGRERLPAVSQSPALGLLHNGHSVNTSSMHEVRLLGKYVVLGLTWQVPTV